MSVSVSAPNAAAGGEGGYSYSIEVVNKHEVQNRISRGKPCPAQHLFNPPTCLRWPCGRLGKKVARGMAAIEGCWCSYLCLLGWLKGVEK